MDEILDLTDGLLPVKATATESVDEILKCDHSNESCCLAGGPTFPKVWKAAVYYAVQGGSNF